MDTQRNQGEQLVRLATEAAAAPSSSAALRRVRALRQALDEFEKAHVAHALSEGASYAAVGRDLGLSRQAIHRRFRRLTPSQPAPSQLAWSDEGPPSLALSPDAHMAFRYAREEAASLEDDVGSEHLLIGVLRAWHLQAVEHTGVSLERVRTQVRGSSPRSGLFKRPRSTRDLRSLLADPAREALRTGSRQIEPAHLLAGILRDPDSAAARTLRAIGADPAKVRLSVLRHAAETRSHP